MHREAPGADGNVLYSEWLLWFFLDHGNASPGFPGASPAALIVVSRYNDRGDKTVAASRDVDDETVPILTVSQGATQRRHMNRQVGGLNENVGPNASHQILLTDQLSVPFEQGN